MSLSSKLQEQGATEEQLDELVQDAASQLASNANNGGISSQLEFLTDLCGWTEEEIIKALSRQR